MWPALLMAGMGAYQFDQQQKKEKRDRQLAASTQQYSPWTGLQAGPISEADLAGTVGQGAVQGVAMEQNMDRADQANKLNEAQLGYYKSNTQQSPASGGGFQGGESAYGMSSEDPEVLKMRMAQSGQNNSIWPLLLAQQGKGNNPYGG